MSELDGRVCTICGIWKSRQEMTKCSSYADDMYSWCKRCNSEKRKKNKKDQRAKGLCINCNRPHLKGNDFCAYHLIGDHARRKNARDDRRDRGSCISCDQPHAEGKVYCQYHLIENRTAVENLNNSRKEESLCQKCGQPACGGILCLRCSVLNNFSNIVRSTLLGRGKSKNSKSWVIFVDYTKKDLIDHVDYWKEIQGLNGDPVEIHHINYRSESLWKEPGDSEWRGLWSLSNLLPLTKSSHNAVHREDYTSLHPEVRRHILKMRGRDDVSMSEMP